MHTRQQPDKQKAFKASVRELAVATSAVLNAWYELSDTDEQELHLSEWHTDCVRCDVMGKAYRAIYTESLEEVTLNVTDWSAKLEALSTA